MPTGYTQALDEGNLSTKKWIMEHLARAFGICITLRDSASNLTESQIEAKLKESYLEEISYHTKELNKAKADEKKFTLRSDAQWKVERDKEYKTEREYHEKAVIKNASKKKLHDKTVADLQEIVDDDKATETTKAIAQFGIEQLKLVESDCATYSLDPPKTWRQFRTDAINKANRSIDYHTEEIEKAEKCWEERLEAYKMLRKDTNRILGMGIEIIAT